MLMGSTCFDSLLSKDKDIHYWKFYTHKDYTPTVLGHKCVEIGMVSEARKLIFRVFRRLRQAKDCQEFQVSLDYIVKPF